MTMTNKVYAHNVLNDVVREVPEHFLTHPILGKNLVKVRNGKNRGRLSELITPDTDETDDEPEFQITFLNTDPETEPDKKED